MDNVTRLLMQGAAGAAGDKTYVDDVFSTYLYKGTGISGSNVTNGIKLSNANAGNSVNFDGTGDYLLTNSSSDYTFGTGDFTVEHWIYTDFSTASQQVIDGRDYSASGDSNWATSIHSSGNEFRFFAITPGGSGAARISNNTTLNANTWYHIAIVRSSGTTKMYIDGVQQTQTFTDANNYNNTTLTLGIHGPNRSSFPFKGNLSDVRITKGQALYTSNFTPSTKSLTTTSQGATASNVKLLCCNTNILTASPGTITAGGNVSAQGFGRFTGVGGKGGLVWIKNRDAAENYGLFDTARGAGKWVVCNANNAEDTDANRLSAFNNSGFSLGTDTMVNNSSANYASWTFRKQKGFFDVVTYTGTQVAGRTVAHSLGSVPGMIFIKRLNDAEDWAVYHRQVGATKALTLNENSAPNTNSAFFNNTEPTASVFSVGTSDRCNKNGQTYVAYVFAGGESTAATARSVDFDGSSDYLSIADNSDFALGSGDFTFEAWIKIDALNSNGAGWLTDWNNGALGWYFGTAYTSTGANCLTFGWSDTGSNINTVDSTYTVKADGQFHHYAITRSGTNLYFFVDGIWVYTHTGVTESFYNPSGAIAVGQNPDVGGSAWLLNGKISNLRLIKGTCLYTSSFIPPTEPLTNVTNTILLCCNNSSVTGSTVTPSSITAVGSPTATTDSPFDDPEIYKFGEEGDQNIIKCGSYIGNGNADGPEIFLGWEPQYVLVKDSTSNNSWRIFDSMRGIPTGGDDALLHPNSNGAEYSGNTNEMDLTSTGFKIVINDSGVNGNGNTYMYTAIRRPDGYVGKPVEAGTDVFAMDTGAGSGVNPTFDSNFAVDMGIMRQPATAQNWFQSARITGDMYMYTNNNAAASSGGGSLFEYDYSKGWCNSSAVGSSGHLYQSWMWRRHTGFDVVTYKGTGSNNIHNHSLNSTPQMMWMKRRDSTGNWYVYHSGLNGGSGPQNYFLQLDTSGSEQNQAIWNNAPTSSVFSVSSDGHANTNNADYTAMLFASVDGISKVGYYDGQSTELTITTGFAPRFIIIRSTNASNPWYTYDTLRGWTGSASDKYMSLDSSAAQGSFKFGSPTSTGFTLDGGSAGSAFNGPGGKYIYYAHA